uniref:rhomboid protease n=1 Tax=Syphacia muris TaxID=451379 RepID=A0A0N5AXI0_9BILA
MLIASVGSSCRRRVLSPYVSYKTLKQIVRTARFGRLDHKPVKCRNGFNRVKNNSEKVEKGEFLLPFRGDVTRVRPKSDLWRAAGFTVLVGGISFSTAAIMDYERSKKQMKQFWSDAMNLFHGMDAENYDSMWNGLSDGQKCVITLIGLNALVFALWKVAALQSLMWQWFTNSYASRSLCAPMILSAFSHSNWIHLSMNMFVVYSFFGRTIDRFLGVDQFCAFYLTAAGVSSLTSLMHKAVIRSPVRALGASGAILSVLVYTCVQMPDARLQIIFIPGFTFSAASGVIGLLAFDAAGLLLGFRLFDHAAHLGGSLFGIFYAWYGEKILWKDFGDRVIKFYRKVFKRDK